MTIIRRPSSETEKLQIMNFTGDVTGSPEETELVVGQNSTKPYKITMVSTTKYAPSATMPKVPSKGPEGLRLADLVDDK